MYAFCRVVLLVACLVAAKCAPTVETARQEARKSQRNNRTEDPHHPQPSLNQRLTRDKDAAEQLKTIQKKVLEFVINNGRPSTSFPAFSASSDSAPQTQRGEHVADLHDYTFAAAKVGRLRYIKPSCELPKHVDKEMWLAPGSMQLHFNVSGIQAREGHQLFVLDARIRLYKFQEGMSGDSVSQSSESSENTPTTDASISDQEKIRVSVHNFTRALRKHRAHKKKLLDSRMVWTNENFMMELNVTLAARSWLVAHGRNYGLVIDIEDSLGQRKPTSSFFQQRDCTPQANGAPRTDEVRDPSEVKSPVLQLTVIELPIATVEASTAEDWLKINGGRWPLTPSFNENMKPSAKQEEQHPHRHHGHQNAPEEQADDASRFASSSHQDPHKHKNLRLARPLPTLTTLEDHDFMTKSDDEFQKFNEQVMRSWYASAGRRSIRKIPPYKRRHFNRF